MTAVQDLLPLSPLQEGLLFEALRRPEGRQHVVQSSFKLRGPLDAGRFAAAWRSLTPRHAVLRSAFVVRGERALQAVLRDAPLPVALEDWRGLPTAERAARLRALRERELAAVDPGRAPLARIALLRLEDDLHQCVWTYHHLILDGWSKAIVVREALLAYARLSGLAVPEPPAGPPYADYAAWLGRQDREAALAHFREALAGYAAPARLPAPAVPAGPGHRVVERELDRAAGARLRDLAARRRVTLSTLAHGAFALALARRAGTGDVVFGTVLAGRPAELAGVEHMVGAFANTLPVRARLAREEAVGGWLAGLQEQLVALREREHASLGAVRACAALPPGVPLFSALLAFENYPVEAAPAAALPVAVEEPETDEVTSLPLAVYVHARDVVGVRVVHDVAVVDAAEADALAGDLAQALASLPRWWSRPLGAVGVVPVSTPPPPPAAGPPSGPGEPPLGAAEELLAGLWRELLRAPAVGRDSDFLALGGDSLLAMRLRARIQRATRVALRMDDLLAARRLRDQALLLAGAAAGAPPEPEPEAERPAPVPGTRRLPASPEQARLLAAELREPGALNLPVLFQLDGPLDLDAFHRALTAVCGRHGALRTAFATEGAATWQVVVEAATPELVRADLRERGPDAATRQAVEDMRRPFAMDAAPLLRAGCYRVAEERHLLAFSMSHLVADGWSRRALAADLVACYRAILAGEEADLAPVAQFPERAAEEAAAWSGSRAREGAARWRGILGDRPPPLRLREATPGRPGDSVAAGVLHFRLPEAPLRRLLEVGREAGATAFATVLAAHQALLWLHSGQERFVVGTYDLGRRLVEEEWAIGCYLNRFGIPADLSDEVTFRDLARSAHEAARRSLAAAEVPFAIVAGTLDPEPAASSAIYQTMFVLENLPTPDLGPAGSRLRAVDIEWPFTRCDLTLRTEPDGRAMFEYRQQAFTRDGIGRLAGDLCRLVEAFAEEPGRPIDELGSSIAFMERR